jgi:hypothetical protein
VWKKAGFVVSFSPAPTSPILTPAAVPNDEPHILTMELHS